MTLASTYHVTRAFDSDKREVICIVCGDISSNLYKDICDVQFADLEQLSHNPCLNRTWSSTSHGLHPSFTLYPRLDVHCYNMKKMG